MHASGVQGCVGWAAVVIHTQACGLRGFIDWCVGQV